MFTATRSHRNQVEPSWLLYVLVRLDIRIHVAWLVSSRSDVTRKLQAMDVMDLESLQRIKSSGIRAGRYTRVLLYRFAAIKVVTVSQENTIVHHGELTGGGTKSGTKSPGSPQRAPQKNNAKLCAGIAKHTQTSIALFSLTLATRTTQKGNQSKKFIVLLNSVAQWNSIV